MVSLTDQREVVGMLIEEHCNISRACKLASLPASSYRYEKKNKDDSVVEDLLVHLTDKHATIGFWSCHHRLRNRGV